MAESGRLKLPIIDLREAFKPENEQEQAAKIVHCLENEGFLYIEGIDVDVDKLRQACDWFFDLPLEEKLAVARQAYNKENKGVYRGYFPMIPGEASRKEAIEVCPNFDISKEPRISPDNWTYEDVLWPKEDATFPFKEFMMDYYYMMANASKEIMRLIAIGLKIPENAFVSMFENYPLSTLRLIHYPSWDGETVKPPPNAYSEDGRLITTPDHSDTTFLTLLQTFDNEGLEILDKNGIWQPVPCRPGGYIMNIGDTFSRMMRGRFKSTRHRVMDINRDRYSVPFFYEPCFYADVGVNWISKFTGVDTDKYKTEFYGPWMIHVMKFVKKFTEARFLPDFDYNLEKIVVGFHHENHPPMAESGSWVIQNRLGKQ